MSGQAHTETADERLARLQGEFEATVRKLPPGAQVQLPGIEDRARLDALVTVLCAHGLVERDVLAAEATRALGNLMEDAVAQVNEVAAQVARQRLVAPPAHTRPPADLRGAR